MKIEYLKEGSADCPLIRIYDFNANAIGVLYRLIIGLCDSKRKLIELTEIEGIYQIGCSLSLAVGVDDKGVKSTSSPTTFMWTLAPETWCTVAGLIEPFRVPSEGEVHQWLAGYEARYGLEDSHIGVVLTNSADGRW